MVYSKCLLRFKSYLYRSGEGQLIDRLAENKSE